MQNEEERGRKIGKKGWGREDRLKDRKCKMRKRERNNESIGGERESKRG